MEILVPATDFVRRKTDEWGPAISGVLFGAGWWFWVDALVCSMSKIPFSQQLPGLLATLALVMINSVRRDEIAATDTFDDEGVFCRAQGWLLASYFLSVGAVAGSVVVMLAHYSASEEGDRWPGVASILQVACILGAALVFFTSRSPGESGGYDAFL